MEELLAQKQCSVCKQYHPATLEYFHSDRRQPDQLATRCKPCGRLTLQTSRESRRVSSPPLVVSEPRPRAPRINEVLPEGYKRCTICQQIFPATEEFFSSRKDAAIGWSSHCKSCKNQRNREQYALIYPDSQINKDVPEGYKRCSQCQEVKPLQAEFFAYSQRDSFNGVSLCLSCKPDYVRSQAAKRLAEQTGAMRHCTLCQQEYPWTTEYFFQNGLGDYDVRCKGCRMEQFKEYRQANKEVLNEKRRIAYAANPDYFLAITRKRQAQKIGNGGTHTAQDIQAQYKRQQGRCYYCNKAFGQGRNVYHVDHVIPLSRGGSNGPENLVIACPTCNESKGDKLLHEWQREQ